MRYALSVAAFGIGASAVSIPRSCTFSLTASGGVSGPVGTLDDGQNRIGGGHGVEQYTINNGAVINSFGNGCILTPEVMQWQCDANFPPMSGFDIGSTGSFTSNGSSVFYACPATDDEYNIYTTPVAGQLKCVEISLMASGCYDTASSSGSSSSAASTAPASTAPASSAPASSTPASSAPATSAPASTAPASSAPASSTPASSAPATSAPASTAPASSAPAISAPASSAPAVESPAPSAPAVESPAGPETVTVTVTECDETVPASTGAASTAPVVSVAPSSAEVPTTSVPASSAPAASVPAASVPASSAPAASVPAASVPASSAPASSAPASTVPASSVPAASVPAASSTTSTAAGTCPTTLLGTSTGGLYQYPHLIVPVSSETPDQAAGTQLNATISSTVSTIFNFDIPASYAGKQCSLLFLFPEQAQLETSAYTFSGTGAFDFAQLSTVATEQTTYNTVGDVAQDFGVMTATPGSTTVVSTFSCQAGERLSYEISTSDSTSLVYFQDWNPSPIGLYVVEC